MSFVPAASCAAAPGETCALCGDEATPARVLAVDGETGLANAEVDGATMTVALDLVDGVGVGDTVLVHQGFAIARVETR